MKRIMSILLMFVVLTTSSFSVCAETYGENDNEETEEVIAENAICELNLESVGLLADTYHGGTFLNNYATNYFYHLRQNFADNEVGSCSYVAAAMLLSYYDTYWNDDIIYDHYDANNDSFIEEPLENVSVSPGIKMEDYDDFKTELGLSSIDVNNYDTIVTNYYGDYFHLYLIKLARDNGIYNALDCYSLFPGGVKNLLEYYLTDKRGFTDYTVNFEHITGFSDVRSYAIEKVKQGIPVFVSTTNIDLEAHSFIIYDYDEINDELYCHMGWHRSGSYHVAFSTLPYTLFEGAVTIEFTGDHVHSNNYVASDGTSYCSCYFSCHPEHEHIYESVNNTYHTYSCQCEPQGAQIEHDMYLSMSVGTNQHGYKCCDCGYIDEDTVEEHSFDFWVFISDTRHIEQCGCGVRGSVTAPHVFRMTDSPLEPKICMGCGYTKFPGGGGNVIMSTAQGSINGSYKMPDGTIYLVDADIEAYLNGTLVFYDKDKVPVTQ